MPLHLFLIHFPVSLILTGAVLDIAGVALENQPLRRWAGYLLIAGGVAAFLGFLTGEGAKMAALSSSEIDLGNLESHQQWGSVGAWALLATAVVRSMWRERFNGGIGWLNLALALGAGALVVAITLSGTAVRHGL